MFTRRECHQTHLSFQDGLQGHPPLFWRAIVQVVISLWGDIAFLAVRLYPHKYSLTTLLFTSSFMPELMTVVREMIRQIYWPGYRYIINVIVRPSRLQRRRLLEVAAA